MRALIYSTVNCFTELLPIMRVNHSTAHSKSTANTASTIPNTAQSKDYGGTSPIPRKTTPTISFNSPY